MEKINVAELLKDCPEGMELDCTLYEKPVKLMWVSPTTYLYPINIQTPGGRISLTEYGCYTTNEHAKCVIFPKGKTTWKEGLGSFKDGDILTTRAGSIFILKESYENTYSYGCYVALDFEKAFIKSSERFCNKEGCCLATEDEKKEMFDAIQAKGYKWNSETKTLEKLIKPIFKNGDVVVCCKKYPFIYSGEDDNYWYCHCGVYIGTNEIGFGDKRWIDKSFNIRLANNEEKEKLFQLIRENGYKWDPDTKTLKELDEPKFKVGNMVQDKDAFQVRITEVNLKDKLYMYESLYSQWIGYICFDEENNWELVEKKCKIITLKPYDRVLVRFSSKDIWRINLFEYYNENLDNPFLYMGHQSFKQCIPYEGNEHLLGTSKDCFEYYHRIEKK